MQPGYTLVRWQSTEYARRIARYTTRVSPSPAAVPTWAAGVCAGLAALACRHVVFVPDNPLSQVLRVLDAPGSGIRTLLATREEEAFGLAAGLALGGERPAVLLQSSGLGNSLNAIASLLLPYQLPTLMIVSMRGDAGEWNPAQVPMGRAVRPVLDAFGIPHQTVTRGADAADVVRSVGHTVFSTNLIGACLLPRSITAPLAPAASGAVA